MLIFRHESPASRSLTGIYSQQFGGRGEMAVEKGLDAGKVPAGRRDGKLLAGDLEQQGTVQVHRRQLSHPRPGSKAGRSSMSRASTGSALRR